jgi:hypothetical protein
MAGWLDPRGLLDTLALGPYQFVFRGWLFLSGAFSFLLFFHRDMLRKVSGATPLRGHTGTTLGALSDQDPGLSVPGPGWLAGKLAGQSCLLHG